MIWAAVSTSSPLASVALFSESETLMADSREAPMRASGAALSMLRAMLAGLSISVKEVELFAADVGPGSFTGVKVGVTIAKTLAYALGRPAAGFSAFDLMCADRPVAIPARKGLYLYRAKTGEPPEQISSDDPLVASALGYGEAFQAAAVFPEAKRAARLFGRLKAVSPMELAPEYVLEPSISRPKRPYPGVPE